MINLYNVRIVLSNVH